jgi:uncharacterized membrane protein YeaQ/YmgE (transglycosylase-associated protein family)
MKGLKAQPSAIAGQPIHLISGGGIMGILVWIVFGLIAGALAKFLMPGSDPGGFIVTTILGIVGAVVGGFIAVQLGYGDITGFDLRSFAIAVLGAIVLLLGYRLVKSS